MALPIRTEGELRDGYYYFDAGKAYENAAGYRQRLYREFVAEQDIEEWHRLWDELNARDAASERVNHGS